ncbi:MAG: hypothetical protein HOW73_27870 [Polyangiaceae bacterium]|nr:hypothetical protein [Polyangiaceae bacterium]
MADRRLALGPGDWKRAFEARLQEHAKLVRLGHLRSVATGPPKFHAGNHAFYMRDGRVHLAWMLAAIRGARRRIDLEMYIFDADATGVLVRDALVDAVRRGVAVRLLYDSIGSVAAGASFFDPIVQAGGLVTEFNPAAPWRLRMSRIGKLQIWQPNARDHRKLLVCDAPMSFVEASKAQDGDALPPELDEDAAADEPRTAIAILGGRNIADHYLSRPLGDGQWRDCGVVIFGPVVTELGKMFDAMWTHAEGPDSAPPVLATDPVGEIDILPLGSQPGFFNPLQWALSRLAATVKTELRISCAYFIPSVRFRRALASAAKRSHRCLILVPKASDVPMVDRASRHLWGALLQAGVSIYRYAVDILHEKTIVYDRVVTVVGSSNLDPRSFRLNYEISVIILGATFAAPVVTGHDRDLQESEVYTLTDWQNRPFWQKLIDWFWSLLRSQL